MKKIYNQNSVNNDSILIRKKSWRYCLALLFGMFLSVSAYSQVTYNYGWEPTGLGSWTTAGTGTFARSTITPCGESASVRANVYYDGTNTFTSPSLGTSLGGLTTFSYKYKIVEFDLNSTGASAEAIEIKVQWSNSLSGPWTTFQLIDESNHVESSTCALQSATFLPAAGNVYVRFLSTAIGEETDLRFYYDDISVSEAPLSGCSGTPEGGTASLSSTTGNSGSTFIASVSGATSASGLDFQWQKFIGGSWMDIAGATSANSTITAETGTVGTATKYRRKSTCTNSSLFGYSSEVTYTLVLVYCTVPANTSGCSGDNISSVLLKNLSDTGLTCTPQYADRSSAQNSIPDLSQALTIPMSVAVGNGGTEHVGVWIDFNKDGQFEASEFTNLGNGNNVTIVGAISIPANALLGNTKMRVRSKWNAAFTGAEACSVVGYGSTRDYTVNIVLPPACIPPSALTTSALSYTAATLAWTSEGTNFDVEWGLIGFTPTGVPTQNGITTNSLNITSLTAETSYDFYVRNNCGGSNGSSTWSGPYTFYTGYCTPTGTSNSYRITGVSTANGYTNISNLGNGTTLPYNNYSAMSVSQSPGADITYTVTVPSSTGIKIWIDLNNDLTFDSNELVMSHLTSPVGGVWAGTLTVPENLPLGTYRMRIRSGYYFYPDQLNACGSNYSNYGEAEDYTLSVVTPPACLAPTNLVASNLGNTSVDLSWTGDNTLFDFEYGIQGYTQGAGIGVENGISNTYNLQGLTSNTSYDVYVRQDCDSNGKSTWSGPLTFSTLCDSVDSLPYLENFDAYGTGSEAFPDCWLRPVTYISGSTWPSIVSGNFSSSPNSLRFQSAIGTPTYAVSPAYSEDIHNLRVKFMLKREGTSSGTMDIGVMSDPSDITTFELVQTINPSNNNMNEYVVNLSSTLLTGSNGHIAFRHNSNANNYYYWMDNFKVELIPSCAEPTVLASSNIAENTATLSWTASVSNPTNGYDIYYSNTNTAPLAGTEPTVDNNPTATYNAIGLSSSSTYYWWVRSDCGSETSIWASGGNFTTNTPPPTNVNCAEAIALVCNAEPETYSSTGSTAVAPAGCTIGSKGIWFSFVGTGADITINSTANFDHKMSMQTGSCEVLTWIACKDGSISAEMYTIENSVLDQTYYVYVAHYSSSSSTTGNITISITCEVVCPTGIWTGTTSSDFNTASNWADNMVPEACTAVTVNVANPMVIESDVEVASITLGTSATVTVNGTLNVGNISVAAGGSMTVANDASVLQTPNAVNTGLVTVLRNSTPLWRQDYTLWSSPVTAQNLRAFSPQTLFNRFSSYNTAAGANGDYVQEIVTTTDANTKTFGLAKGYLIRMPNNWVINGQGSAASYAGSFEGTLNNGSVSFPLSGANTGMNLVGNPYPSAINISDFWTANVANLESTAYFWRKTNGVAGSGYIAYNLMGGTNGSLQMDNIKTGQGFFVVANSATPGSLVFNNDMRTNVGTSNFYKSPSNVSEVHRLWLNLSDATDVVGQALIGYASGATQGVDNGFDAKYFNDSALALTSLINNNEYSIQGRSLPFVDTDVVPLGFKSDVVGNFTISLANFDGVFAENQDIFLKDNATNTIQNLKLADYTFTTLTGVFNDRFEVQYNSTLGTTNPTMDVNSILIGVKDQQIKINSGSIEMQKIELIDVTGRVIYTLNGVSATTATIDRVTAANQMLIVRISTTSNGVVNQKIIF